MSEFKMDCIIATPDTVAAQAEMIARISKICPSVTIEAMPYDIQKVFAHGVLSELELREFILNLARNVEKWFDIIKKEKIKQRLSESERNVIAEALYVLEFYIDILSEEKFSALSEVKVLAEQEINIRNKSTADNDECYTVVVESEILHRQHEEFDETKIFSEEVDKIFSDSETNEYEEKTEEVIAGGKERISDSLFETVENESARKVLKDEALKSVSLKLNSSEGQIEVVSFLADLLDVENLLSEISAKWNELLTDDCDYKKKFKRIIGETAIRINKIIGDSYKDDIRMSVEYSEKESLLKTWLGLDYYSFVLKPEYCTYIRNLRDYISTYLTDCECNIIDHEPEIENIGNDSGETLISEKIEAAKAALKDAVSYDKGKEAVALLEKELAELILCTECVYVAYDDAYSDKFPYIGLTGKAEIFTNSETAELCRRYYSECSEGSFSVKTVTKENYCELFNSLFNLGIKFFNLDNGTTTVEMSVDLFVSKSDSYIVDSSNAVVRNCLIRRMQLISRFNSISDENIKRESRNLYVSSLNSLASAAYTNLCNGVVYGLMHGPYVENVTFYTKDAYETADSLIREQHAVSDVDFICPCDNRYNVIDSVQKIGAVNIRNAGIHSCIFTDRNIAEQVRKEFAESGSNDNVVVMTFKEALNLSQMYDGIAIDMPSYAYLIDKNEVVNILSQL